MYLILCPEIDPCGEWLARGLRAAGLDPVELVSDQVFAAGRDWYHQLDGTEAWFRVRLPDGRVIDSRRVAGTVNRLQLVRPPQLSQAGQDDGLYAEQEFTALVMSLLACLPAPLFNPPASQGLSGAMRHPSEWVWMAVQAGLPTLPYVLESGTQDDPFDTWGPLVPPGAPTRTVLAVGDELVCGESVAKEFAGSLSAGYRQACLELARRADLPLLGIDFLPLGGEQIVFVSASPCPDLTRGGAPLIEALARQLQGEERAVA